MRNGSETTNLPKSIIDGVKHIEKQQMEKNKVISLILNKYIYKNYLHNYKK
jgi:hypothetical protein